MTSSLIDLLSKESQHTSAVSTAVMDVSLLSNRFVGLCKILEDKSKTLDVKLLSNCMWNVVAYNLHSLEKLMYGTLQVINGQSLR